MAKTKPTIEVKGKEVMKELYGLPFKPTQEQIELMDTDPLTAYNELYRNNVQPESFVGGVKESILSKLQLLKNALLIIMLFVVIGCSTDSAKAPVQRCGTVVSVTPYNQATVNGMRLVYVTMVKYDDTGKTEVLLLSNQLPVDARYCSN